MRITFILSLLFTVTFLQAQSKSKIAHWGGLHNIHIKNKEYSSRSYRADSILILNKELLDKQYSFGIHYRQGKKNNTYYQIDFIGVGWKGSEDLTTVTRLDIGLTQIVGGEEIEEWNVETGFQMGRFFPLLTNLNADIGVRAFSYYKYRKQEYAVSTINGQTDNSLGLGLNVKVGLNYQLFRNINIGYHITPMTIRGFWNKNFVDNPTFPNDQTTNRRIKLTGRYFEDMIAMQNFRISFVF